MRKLADFNQDLMGFIKDSPSPFHAVKAITAILDKAGFSQLSEGDSWQLGGSGRYYVIRNGSSIVTFTLAGKSLEESGFRMVGAHTDSPCLKVKPKPEINKKGYFQLGVEVYGGVLLNPWFDRDLSLAGRVSYRDKAGQIKSALVDFKKAIASIPSLAIHLDRDANKSRTVNAQKDIPPVLMRAIDETVIDFRELLLKQLQQAQSDLDISTVLDYELSFYDTQPPSLIGLHDEFIASARLDNLLSCFVGLQALLESDQENCLLVCSDHEEVGSMSAAGAQGPLLKSVLERIAGSTETLARAIDRSMLISVDNAHGVHPNYTDRHDDNHGPILNKGPVIKTNANQRYASNAETSALFRQLCTENDVPVQAFVVRTDMACGSTIGPITASEIGVKTLDVGVPQFAMHSIRELAGSEDAYALYKALRAFNHWPQVSLI